MSFFGPLTVVALPGETDSSEEHSQVCYPPRLENEVMEIINQGRLLGGGDIYNGL